MDTLEFTGLKGTSHATLSRNQDCVQEMPAAINRGSSSVLREREREQDRERESKRARERERERERESERERGERDR
jgi:hypothetical protein